MASSCSLDGGHINEMEAGIKARKARAIFLYFRRTKISLNFF